jgi:hypothetical protein
MQANYPGGVSMTSIDIHSKMATVRKLLDKAEGTDNVHEEAAFRAKAEALMAQYSIDVNQLLMNKIVSEGYSLPNPVPFDIRIATSGSEYYQQYAHIFGNIARHVGIRHIYHWERDAEGTLYAVAKGVGFEMDVQYAELLFTQARMVFGERLEPKVKPELSDQENVYRLRSAGIERVRIADIMWGNRDKAFLGRVGRLYKAECAQRGEEAALSGRGVTGAAYREAYSEGFVDQFRVQLIRARDAAGVGGKGLVLGNREEALNEAFYTRFPETRPKAAVGGGTSEYVDPRSTCDKCQKAKSGACREHPYGPALRASAGRDPYSAAATRGRASGATAARSVDLGRGTGTRAVSN